METPKHINDEDGEVNATNMDNQESSVQDNPFRTSELNELRSPVQPVCIQNFDLNKDSTGEKNKMGYPILH